MAKITPIADVVNELYETLLTSGKKQRKIRSGTFWNKFRFERRTKERVEAVKSALKEKSIQFNVDDVRFGTEKRNELIVFSLLNSKDFEGKEIKEANSEEVYPVIKQKEPGEVGFESIQSNDEISARLNHLAPVEQENFYIAYVFSILIVEIFKNDTPSYEISPGVYGATRSNWTYHTASAISQTCKILNLNCKFEALGKRDAIIETKDQSPEMILAAEWEWDYNDIFGKGKELEKLRITCQKNPTADAFLLIYCPSKLYLNHLEKIAEYWINETKKDEYAPNLFLHTIIFEEKGNSREFQLQKLVMIHPTGINICSETYL